MNQKRAEVRTEEVLKEVRKARIKGQKIVGKGTEKMRKARYEKREIKYEKNHGKKDEKSTERNENRDDITNININS